jgi:hypothetical protein
MCGIRRHRSSPEEPEFKSPLAHVKGLSLARSDPDLTERSWDPPSGLTIEEHAGAMRHRRSSTIVLAVCATLLAACSASTASSRAGGGPTTSTAAASGIAKI